MIDIDEVLTAEERALLEDEPWLRWYIRDSDADLIEDARIRFTVAQSRAVRVLRAHDEEVEARQTRRGMLTTAYQTSKVGDS
jgi:hypothetical protein